MKKILLGASALLILACQPVASAHDFHESKALISVSATGISLQAPDTASVSAGVVTQGMTAGEAMRSNADQMNAVFEQLKAAGIPSKNIQTSQLSLQPRYNYKDRQAPTIEGYKARNTVTAKSEDLGSVGPMLDALVRAGVNNINGVQFSIKDSKAAKDAAREDAIKEARAKAQSMAAAAGVKLGKLQSLSEAGGNFRPQNEMMMAARTMAMDSAPTPIAAGEQSLSVTVNMTYAIDN